MLFLLSLIYSAAFSFFSAIASLFLPCCRPPLLTQSYTFFSVLMQFLQKFGPSSGGLLWAFPSKLGRGRWPLPASCFEMRWTSLAPFCVAWALRCCKMPGFDARRWHTTPTASFPFAISIKHSVWFIASWFTYHHLWWWPKIILYQH